MVTGKHEEVTNSLAKSGLRAQCHNNHFYPFKASMFCYRINTMDSDLAKGLRKCLSFKGRVEGDKKKKSFF